MGLKQIKSFFRIHFYYKMFYSKPDFIIIGAPRSGTTSLFHYLSVHEEITPSEYKEPAFFAWHNNKGYDWYLSKFPKKNEKKKKLTFEATPLYLYEKKTPELIKKYLPNVKLVAILRNPVERAYSHWNFYNNSKYVHETEWRIQNLKDHRTFQEAVNDEMRGILKSDVHAYLSVGFYKVQFERYFKYFNRDQILILDFSELEKEINTTMKKVCDFLKISSKHYESVKFTNKKLNEYIAVAKKGDQKEKSFLIHNANKYRNKMPVDTYNQLIKYFREKNKNLNQLTGIDFSWN